MMADTLGIGIVGVGFVGEYHAADISRLEDQRLVAIAEPNEALREKVKAQFSVPRAYVSWEELVQDDTVDVVYICTPNDLHLPITAAAMDAGKDVVCEKPIARSAAEGRAMIEKSRQTGRKLFIAFNQRFRPSHQKTKQMLDEGAIGRPFLAMSTFIGNEFERMNDPKSWKGTLEKSGGGVLIDNGTHLIDCLNWWFGEAESVISRCKRIVVSAQNKEEDTSLVAIEYKSGVLAELAITFGARYSTWPKGYIGAAIRTEIYALDGSIRCGNDDPPLSVAMSDGTQVDYAPDDIFTGMPASLHAHFADCIRGNAKPIVTAEDGVAALEVIEAAYKSEREGRRVNLGEVRL
jgi:predicted dehydrogenase